MQITRARRSFFHQPWLQENETIDSAQALRDELSKLCDLSDYEAVDLTCYAGIFDLGEIMRQQNTFLLHTASDALELVNSSIQMIPDTC